LKEERPSKLASDSGNHLREFKIVFKCDVDGLQPLRTEITVPEKMVPGTPGFQQGLFYGILK
jgi:hypothetical protein